MIHYTLYCAGFPYAARGENVEDAVRRWANGRTLSFLRDQGRNFEVTVRHANPDRTDKTFAVSLDCDLSIAPRDECPL